MTTDVTLPHGLKKSVLGSPYKTEEDANLERLDLNRITQVVATVASLPAAGTVGRFVFSRDTGTLYYDNGTTWDTQVNAAKGTILMRTRVAISPTQTKDLGQLLKYDQTPEYGTGILASATIDGTGGLVIPAGVSKIKISTRTSFDGATPGTPVGLQLAIAVYRAGGAIQPDEAPSQVFYVMPNSLGWVPLMMGTQATVEVLPADVINLLYMFTTAAMPNNIAVTDTFSDIATWMHIEAV